LLDQNGQADGGVGRKTLGKLDELAATSSPTPPATAPPGSTPPPGALPPCPTGTPPAPAASAFLGGLGPPIAAGFPLPGITCQPGSSPRVPPTIVAGTPSLNVQPYQLTVKPTLGFLGNFVIEAKIQASFTGLKLNLPPPGSATGFWTVGLVQNVDRDSIQAQYTGGNRWAADIAGPLLDVSDQDPGPFIKASDGNAQQVQNGGPGSRVSGSIDLSFTD
jgi:hypothetical protein